MRDSNHLGARTDFSGTALLTLGRIGRVLAAAAVILAIGAPSFADPIRIVTGGSVGITLDDDTGFALLGDGFWIQGEAPGSGGALTGCMPCAPGTILDLSTVATVTRFPIEPDRPTFDGRTYEDAFYDGTFTLRAGSITVPDIPVDGFASLTAPFTFEGRMTAFDNQNLEGTPLFATRLGGQGTVRVPMFHNPGVGVFGGAIHYEFEPAAPVPEPATMLLLGTGLAGAMVRRRRAGQP